MMEAVKTIWSKDGRSWVTIYRDGSRFTFKEHFDTTGLPGSDHPDDFAKFGGVYDSAETAEREARVLTCWLRASG